MPQMQLTFFFALNPLISSKTPPSTSHSHHQWSPYIFISIFSMESYGRLTSASYSPCGSGGLFIKDLPSDAC